ncbi:MAG: hypothetical protein KF777_05015 [Planctomycetaceae bacterium]|nr:hypothetical protein [Planctomycetaceae bacterium]
MRMEEFPERADRLACRLLSTDGDTILQHMAIMQSMSYGLSGSYVLRKYAEIMLHDRDIDFAVDKDEISPSASIRLYGVSNLVLRKCVTAEAAINQMLLLAALPEASPGCRGCAFAIIADVARLAPIMQEVVSDATRRDMYVTAESAVCDNGLTDGVRTAAIDVWSSDLWLNNGMSQTAPTAKLVIACAEIVKDPSHSLHLRSQGLGVLKETPEQSMQAAAEAALAVIASEAGEDMERQCLLNAAFECLSECGTGSESECEVIQNFSQRPKVADGASRRAVRLLDKWRAAK